MATRSLPRQYRPNPPVRRPRTYTPRGPRPQPVDWQRAGAYWRQQTEIKTAHLPSLGQMLAPEQNSFGVLRLAMATAVLISHCFYLWYGTTTAEPLYKWTGYTLGQHGVQVFFFLSGVLVAQSLAQSQSVRDYAISRAFRIFPALVVCVLVTVLAIGPWLTTLDTKSYLNSSAVAAYVLKTVSLSTGSATLPGLFEATPVPNVVNSSLWTLKYEVLCYMILAGIGFVAIRSKRPALVAGTALAGWFLLMLYYRPQLTPTAPFAQVLLYFTLFFGSGVAAYALRDSIKISGHLAALFVLVAVWANKTNFHEIALTLALGYGALWLATLRFGGLRDFTNQSDYSYGVYIYGVPVTQALLTLMPSINLVSLVGFTLAITTVAAFLSWELVERPALRLKLRFLSHGAHSDRVATLVPSAAPAGNSVVREASQAVAASAADVADAYRPHAGATAEELTAYRTERLMTAAQTAEAAQKLRTQTIRTGPAPRAPDGPAQHTGEHAWAADQRLIPQVLLRTAYPACVLDRVRGPCLFTADLRPLAFAGNARAKKNTGGVTVMTKLTRRTVVGGGAAAGLGLAMPHIARAQGYPGTQTIKVVVPYPAGGSTDIVGRTVADALAALWKTTVIVENVAGAGANVGMDRVAKGPTDGTSLLIIPPNITTNQFLYQKMLFDPEKDIVPISQVSSLSNLLVTKKALKFASVKEFIDYLKANPGKINFASSGVGTTIHLSGEMFKRMAGVDMVHVAYRGSAPALNDLVGGQVDVMFDNLPSVHPQVKAGTLNGLAVTAAKRVSFAPEFPTVAETVPGFDVQSWFGIGVRAGTSAEIIKKIEADIATICKQADVRERLGRASMETVGSSQADFQKWIDIERKRWGQLITDLKITAQ